MRQKSLKICVVVSIFIIINFLNFIPLSSSSIVKIDNKMPDSFNGNILFSPMQSKKTYLIDNNQEIIHSWESNYRPGLSVYLLENGNIIRTTSRNNNPGGGVQEITWDGNIIWDFTHFNSDHISHHDIEPLPNGNILMISWEFKTSFEAIAAGRDPNTLPDGKLVPDYIIEVKPTNLTSGEIVWEWHIWDHLIQDYDPSKDNYGVVADHPELIDINYISNLPFEINDWTHINAIDYNVELDQIIISSWAFCEIWIIDHSTTKEEAAGHTGGNNGKGGDLLYRWGNPRTYYAGTLNDQKFFGQHDAQWIESGCPGEGNIIIFNNGLGRPGPDYSSIYEIVPPVDENGVYSLIPGDSFDPEDPIWIYTAETPTDFFSNFISGVQRLPDGNTLICDSPNGVFFEVTPDKATVWEFINPYPNYNQNNVFKIRCYSEIEPPPSPDLECEGELYWKNIKAGSTINDSFIIKNIGSPGSKLNWEIDLDHIPTWGTWTFSSINGSNLLPENGSFPIEVSVSVPNEIYKEYYGDIKIVNLIDLNDFDIIPVYISTPKNSIMINKCFLRYIKIIPLIQKILNIYL